jgi:hypothetical protein
MPRKRGPPEGAYGAAPRGPHETVKAGSLEPPPPAVTTRPSPPRSRARPPGPRGLAKRPRGLPPGGRPPVRWLTGANGAPTSCSDVVRVGKAGSPSGRGPEGDRALVVVRGRESRPHGDGGQAARAGRGEGCQMQRDRPPGPAPPESRMLGNLPVGFGERGGGTGHGLAPKAPVTERAGTGYAGPQPPRPTPTLSAGMSFAGMVRLTARIHYRKGQGARPGCRPVRTKTPGRMTSRRSARNGFRPYPARSDGPGRWTCLPLNPHAGGERAAIGRRPPPGPTLKPRSAPQPASMITMACLGTFSGPRSGRRGVPKEAASEFPDPQAGTEVTAGMGGRSRARLVGNG